jgi:hypothetical protein
MVDGAAYNSTLVTNLHVQATMVSNVRQLVNIVLDTTSSNYIWCDLMLIALTRYSLADHIHSNNAFTGDPAWTKMDVVVLCWPREWSSSLIVYTKRPRQPTPMGPASTMPDRRPPTVVPVTPPVNPHRMSLRPRRVFGCFLIAWSSLPRRLHRYHPRSRLLYVLRLLTPIGAWLWRMSTGP